MMLLKNYPRSEMLVDTGSLINNTIDCFMYASNFARSVP